MQLDKVWLQKTISISGRSVTTSETIWKLQNIADLKLKSDSDATEALSDRQPQAKPYTVVEIRSLASD